MEHNENIQTSPEMLMTLFFYIVSNLIDDEQINSLYSTMLSEGENLPLNTTTRMKKRHIIESFQKSSIEKTQIYMFSVFALMSTSQFKKASAYLETLKTIARKRTELNLQKVVFLDIDGVLNRLYSAPGEIEEETVKLLKEIIVDDEPNTAIVLCSYWKDDWENSPYTNTVNGIRLDYELNKHGLFIYDKTPSGITRDYEIRKWLKEHSEVKSFVILDDDGRSFTYEIKDNHIQVNSSTGLTENDVNNALNKLNPKGD